MSQSILKTDSLMSEGRLQKALGQTAIYAIGIGASKGTALLLVPFYTRQLPATAIALWDLSTTTVLFLVAIVELSMASAMARFYIQADDDTERRAVSGSAITVVLVMATLAIAGALTFRARGAEIIFGDVSQSELFTLCGVITALTVLSNQPLAQLRARDRSVAFSLLNLIRAIVGPACTIYLVLIQDWGVKGILVGDAVGLAFMTVGGLAMVGRNAVPSFDVRIVRRLVAFGAPLIVASLSVAIVLVSDRYFLRAHIGLADLAVYTIGFKVAMLMSLSTQALQLAWAPSAYRIAKDKDAFDILARAFRIILVGNCLMALTLTAMAPELTTIFGPGDAYVGAERIAPIIIFSYALQSTFLVMATNLTVLNRTLLVMFQFGVGATAKLMLNLVLIPQWGIVGAAFATLFAFTLQLMVCYSMTRFVQPIPYEIARITRLLLMVTATAFAMIWSYDFSWPQGLSIRILALLLFLGGIVGARIIPIAEWSAAWRAVRGPSQAS